MGFTPETLKRFQRTLGYLRLPPQTRKQLMQKILWRLKDRAKKNVTAQQNPDGSSWEERKKKVKGGKLKQKMLRKGAVFLDSKIENAGDVGRLHYGKEDTAGIFYIHHTGATVPVKQTEEEKAQLKKVLASTKEPATSAQIKRLKELGYQVAVGKYKSGKVKYKTVSRNSGLNQGKAGIIIRYLEEKQGINIRRGLSSYKMAKRQFLDDDESRNADIITEEIFKAFEKEGIHLTL